MRLLKFGFVLALLLSIGLFTAVAQAVDTDGDGLPDTDDRCPTVAGPRSNHGCPITDVDTDGDGLPDSDDQCPTVAGPRANKGCPVPDVDTDGDGLPDSDDQCPTVAGPRTNRGCPVPDPQATAHSPSNEIASPGDSDGDGIPDHSDNCPTVVGIVENQGCPEPPPFNPPLLSNHACFVTPSGDHLARVRVFPNTSSQHIGNLLPGTIYPALGIETVGDEQWVKLAGEFEHLDFEMLGATDAYVAKSVVLVSNCPDLRTDNTMHSIDELACTVVTAFDWIFAFNYAPGANIPIGANPLAILNGDLDLAGDANHWQATTISYGDEDVEYMQYPGWASFPRTGGTCGTIGEANMTSIGIFIPPNDAELVYSTQFGIVVQAAFADCNNNGIDDLDEFWPPDCFGQLTANTSGDTNAAGFDPNDQDDIDFAWQSCPEGWIVHEDDTLECFDWEIEDD